MVPLERVDFLTRHYPQLKGLRLVPLGLALLVIAAAAPNWPVPNSRADVATSWIGIAIPIAIGAAAWLNATYAARFGDVTPLPRRGRTLALAVAVILFLALAQFDRITVSPVLLSAGWIALCLSR